MRLIKTNREVIIYEDRNYKIISEPLQFTLYKLGYRIEEDGHEVCYNSRVTYYTSLEAVFKSLWGYMVIDKVKVSKSYEADFNSLMEVMKETESNFLENVMYKFKELKVIQ